MCNLDRIIDKCKEGDRQAAEKIYQIFSAKMFALCLRFSKDRADAEDTLQDGFIKIFTSIGQYTGSLFISLNKLICSTSGNQPLSVSLQKGGVPAAPSGDGDRSAGRHIGKCFLKEFFGFFRLMRQVKHGFLLP